ncbi:MAG: methyltransferase [Acidobacteriia bacterium]|nr:methyltransferase [Methyloceanibacter sp.]MCL6492802.1 methyltransferase [Terriglobia bacterium]
MTETKLNPARIMQIGMGFFAAKTLLSAVEIGVFAALAAGPLTEPALRARLGLHARAAADFLDALVALGLLARVGDGPGATYANTKETAVFLDPASPRYIGGILKMANNRLYRFWGNLTEALRTGRPQNETKDADTEDAFAVLYEDPDRLKEFLDAMAGVQMANFEALCAKFDFGRYRTICDVGGASGALSLIIARHFRGVHCISFDLPEVTAVAERRIAQSGLADRIKARSGNFLKDELPPADVITMGNILHDWGTATKESLIAKAYKALSPNGALIAIEEIIDDARREHVPGLLMSLNMLIETAEGYNFTFRQFDTWCRAAGFNATELIPLAGTSSAAIAWKGEPR